MPGRRRKRRPSAWQVFCRDWENCGYGRAVDALMASSLPQEKKTELLERAGRINLAALKVEPDEYRRNRRRPGVFQ